MFHRGRGSGGVYHIGISQRKADREMPQEKTAVNMLEDIAIDDAHCDLIYGLVRSQKPRSILEIGYGSGNAYRRIMQATIDNGLNPNHTVVDNWHDWEGKRPDHVPDNVWVDEFDEGEFVNSCRETFDFILIDADHSKSDQYFNKVYEDLLKDYGLLIYHDVTNVGWPNLTTIWQRAMAKEAQVLIFNKNSSPGERCDRGLLVIFK
jgi:predicted O-methyltransferase YrrM